VSDDILVVSRHSGADHVLGSVSFDDRDASVYLRPISRRDALYHYGGHALEPGEVRRTFPTSDQLRAAERPHISIHESGKCHVRTSKGRVASVDAADVGPLKAMTGFSVGTIFCGNVTALAKLDDVWPDVGARDEHAEPWNVTSWRPGDVALKVAVWISRNPQKQQPEAHQFREVIRRRRDGGKLYVALNAIATPPLGGDTPAIGAIGGWDDREAKDLTKRASFVFVRDSLERRPSSEA
jgi:hypothetical protein